MGTMRGDNGGNRPPDNGGSPEGVPDLPPEWGVIVIPDDPADLAAEAARVRRAFRRQVRRARWRRRLHLPARPTVVTDEESPALAIPLLIMSIAVVATLTSLFAVAWPAQPRPSGLRPGALASAVATSNGSIGSGPAGPATSAGQQRDPGTATVTDVALADPTGGAVRVRDLAPAVLLLVDGCECTSLISDTVLAAAQIDPEIAVVAITRSASALSPVSPGIQVRQLVDAGGLLRGALPVAAGRAGTAAALLIGPDATLARAVPVIVTVEDIRADLTRLHS